MHSIIAAVVGAEDREDALSEAEYTFELLCGEQSRIYDYYELFPDHETKSDETDRLEKHATNCMPRRQRRMAISPAAVAGTGG